MAKRVTFSGENLSLPSIIGYHHDSNDGLRLLFSTPSPRFAFTSPADVRKQLNERLAELDRNSTLTLLAAVEAAFRIDYLQRCQQKKKDAVSVRFRAIFQTAKEPARPALGKIFAVWESNTPGRGKLIEALGRAFESRHWMAHGRYWTPKFQQFDYVTVYPLAVEALNAFPLMAP